MSTTSNAIFTGTSRFTNDFQQVIDRSVAIASLPIQQLTNRKNALTDQQTELGTLNGKFASLQSAIQNLSTASGLGSLASSVSDGSIARVNISTGAQPASYSLEVTSLGSFTNTLSSNALAKVSDPSSQNVSTSGQFTITVNGAVSLITPQSKTLSSLAAALNTTPGLNVQASLVNIGSSSSPDYRLSIQSSKLGPSTIQINDGTSDLLNTLSTGSLAAYKVNGLSTAITSDSRSVTLAPGVSVDLLGQSASGVAATLSVSKQTGSIANAFSSFVAAYNSTVDELGRNRGQVGGALTGQSLISELGNRLSQLGSYSSGSASTNSLASLGIAFDGKGHLSFDSTAFSAAASGNLAALTSFLGSSTSGGFLATATNLLSSVEDPATGSIFNATTSLHAELTAQQLLIDNNQARVDRLKTNLQAQLAKADAQVAALEQSYAVLTGLFQAQQYNNQNK